jgi:hypothetical protein
MAGTFDQSPQQPAPKATRIIIIIIIINTTTIPTAVDTAAAVLFPTLTL